MLRTCNRCGFERDVETGFYKYRNGSLNPWCKECYREWYRERGGYSSTRTVQCEWCDASFDTPYARSLFCSPRCKNAAAQYRRRTGQRRKPDRQCVHCGQALPRAMRSDARFCSEECNSAAHQVTRKMAKRANAPRPDDVVSRAYIAQRDKWRCGICGGRVSKDKKHPDPMCASIDHIVPVSLGGGNEPENLRLSHLLCNLRRRADATNDQLVIVG